MTIAFVEGLDMKDRWPVHLQRASIWKID